MQYHPFRNRASRAAKNRIVGAGNRNHSEKKSFATFLTESEIWPLAFAGRCIQQFGFGAVTGFVLGAALVYGYAALIKPLPGSRAAAPIVQQVQIPTPAPAKTVVLHGTVKSHETQFEIGVLAIRRGPFQPNGSYSIEVPESDRYLVIGWYPDYSKFKMQDMSPDKSGTLQELVFPTSDMVRQDGPANNQRNRAADNYALAANRKSPAKDGPVR